MRRSRCFFTLLEVVVSLAILAISLTGILELMTESQKRLAKSYEAWRRMHMLSQAAEFYLLHDDDPPGLPEDIFPYRDHEAELSFEDIEDLPDEYTDGMGQIPLKCLRIALRRLSDNKIVDETRIDRLSYDTAADATEN